MARHRIELEPDPEVTVIGICSHVKDYRLCWSLNKALGLRLTRCRQDILDTADGQTTAYAVFEHREEDPPGRYLLVENHGSGHVLLKEHRHADRFLVVDDELAARRPDLLERIRDAEFVLTAFDLPYARIRAGYKLLPDLP